MSEIIAGLLGGLIAIYVSFLTNNSSLDGSSKWREELLNVASKYELEMDHVQRVRASLRMFKHAEDEVTIFSFDWFTNIMIDELEPILENGKLSESDEKVVRLFANFLLKYHYEYQSEMGPNQIILGKRDRNNQENDLVKETFEELFNIRGGKINV